MKGRPQRNKSNSPSRTFSRRRNSSQTGKRFILSLIVIGFLLYALLAWVLPFFIGGLSFLNNFKSSPKTGTPVSEDATLAPPVLNIAYEATNTAGIKIKGYTVPNSSVEIYLDDELKATTKAGDDGSFLTDNVPLSLGTNNIFGKTLSEEGKVSLPSKPIQVFYAYEKPGLNLNRPQDNQTVTGGDKKVTVSGTTDSGKNITLTVNGGQVVVDANGGFSKTVDLNDGDNNIAVTAADQAGNSTTIQRKVIYQP